MKVTAAQAAFLVGRDVSVVRWHLARGDLKAERMGGRLSSTRKRLEGGSWRIDTDDLERIPGWKVDPTRLSALAERDARSVEGLQARLARMEAEIQTLRSRVRLLESTRSSGEDLAAVASVARSEANLSEQGAWDTYHTPVVPYVAPHPPERTYSLTMRESAPGTAMFSHRSDAMRWLQLHSTGLSLLTPKTWPGWREVELTQRSILSLAISLCDSSNHRVTWRLHQCSVDPLCVCHELLA